MRTLTVVSAALLAVAVFSPASRASAAETTLTLVHQDLALAPDATLSISVSADHALPPNSTVVVTAYKPVLTRGEFANDVAGNLPRSIDTLDLNPEAVSSAAGVTTFAIPTESSSRTPSALQFAQPGLYPVVVDVRSDSAVVAELITFVDRLPKPNDEPRGSLDVSVIASVSAPPAIPGQADSLSPIVVQQLADLTTFPTTVPLSIAVSPELLDRVDAATKDHLRQVFNSNLVLSQPRIPFDPSAAIAAGKADRFTQLLRDGENAVGALGDTAPSDRSIWWSTAHLTTSGASFLRDLGTRLIVLSPDDYANASGNLGGLTDTTQQLQTTLPDATSVPTMVVDPVMAGRIDNSLLGTEQAALNAAADLVVTRDQLASVSAPIAGHTMIIGLSNGGVPNPALFARLHDMVAATDAINFVTLDRVERSTTEMLVDGLPVQLVLPLTPTINISDRLANLDKLNAQALTISGMLVNDAGRPARWSNTIGVLASSALSDADVTAAMAQLTAEFDAITHAVAPRPAYAFTLSGRRTTVRIRIENTSDEPLKVLVRMSSIKLTFPDGDQVVVIEPKSVTDVAIPVVARTNGSFPVTLDVLSPDGGTPLANTLFLKARVSALTGLAQLLTGGGLLILLAWWARHLRTTRRDRRTAETMNHHPVANPRDVRSSEIESSANLADS